jgi:hypothetical protein
MGYDLHITRRDFWADPEGPEIPLEEWVAFASNSPLVEPDSENPGPANWVMSQHPKKWPIWWWKVGGLHTKNPDPQAVAILVKIAAALSARVMGDDDEIYGVDPADPSICLRR